MRVLYLLGIFFRSAEMFGGLNGWNFLPYYSYSTWNRYSNLCVSDSGQVLKHTPDFIGQHVTLSLTMCQQVCLQNSKCNAVEWYQNGLSGYKCYFILDQIPATKWSSENQRLGATCYIKPDPIAPAATSVTPLQPTPAPATPGAFTCNDFKDRGSDWKDQHFAQYCFESRINSKEFCFGTDWYLKHSCTDIDVNNHQGIRIDFPKSPMRFNIATTYQLRICHDYHPNYLQNLAKALGYSNFRIDSKKAGTSCALAWLDASGNYQEKKRDKIKDARIEKPYSVSFYG